MQDFYSLKYLTFIGFIINDQEASSKITASIKAPYLRYLDLGLQGQDYSQCPCFGVQKLEENSKHQLDR